MFATPGPNNAMLTASGQIWICQNSSTFNWYSVGTYFSNRFGLFGFRKIIFNFSSDTILYENTLFYLSFVSRVENYWVLQFSRKRN